MADLLTEFTQFVAAAAGMGVSATMFRGGLPAEQTAAAVSAIIATGGLAGEYSPVTTRTYQVITRSIDSHLQPAIDQAEAIVRALSDERNLPRRYALLGDYLVQGVDVIQGPADIGLDKGGRRRTIFNVQVTAVELE